MPSRETATQIVVVVIAVASFLAIPSLLDVPFDSLTSVGLTILFNATVFGGAHLYLALRGDGDGLPIRGRWRTVALVAGLAALTFLVNVLSRLSDLPNHWITLPAVALGIAAVAAYWYLEARDGYRDARPIDQGAT